MKENVTAVANQIQINLYWSYMTKGVVYIDHNFGALIASKRNFIKNW